MENATIKTANRKLENILWALGIHHLAWEKNEDNMTVWIYRDTPEVRMIRDMFFKAESDKRKAGW